MVYRYGIRPSWKSEIEIGEDHVFGKDEYGLIKNHVFKTEPSSNKDELNQLTESKVAQDYIAQIHEGGGTVKYLRISSKLYHAPSVYPWYYKEFTIEECVFVGNAIPIAVIYGIIALVGIVLLYYRPLILKLLGVSIWQTLISDIGIAWPIIAIILVLVFVLPFLSKQISQ